MGPAAAEVGGFAVAVYEVTAVTLAVPVPVAAPVLPLAVDEVAPSRQPIDLF
ncbi:hypothetical protein [Streptomyces sp. NPDC059247]|uniref:hypothetical protein n=1 Tax=Streptomyces sp. NPDC059247 TaxID=3346790 RepID=UPI00368CC97D